MSNARTEERVAVRFGSDDIEALDWLQSYVQGLVGSGVRIERSDAIRWALHTAREGLDQRREASDDK